MHAIFLSTSQTKTILNWFLTSLSQSKWSLVIRVAMVVSPARTRPQARFPPLSVGPRQHPNWMPTRICELGVCKSIICIRRGKQLCKRLCGIIQNHITKAVVCKRPLARFQVHGKLTRHKLLLLSHFYNRNTYMTRGGGMCVVSLLF